MSSSTTFILSSTPTSSSSSSSTALPESPYLSLLPFSLGTSTTPYTTTSAPLLNYFKPRPSGSDDGSVIASFRGRSVIGQYIELPIGYKGLILSTGKRPDRGGMEVHQDTQSVDKPSIVKNDVNEDEDDGTSLRRTTRQSSLPNARNRIKGAGQVALSKPRARTNIKQTTQSKKRFRLDSDDSASEDEQSKQLTRTPSKRSRLSSTSYTTPKKSIVEEIQIPEIVIQEATPLKNPLPTPKKRLNSVRRKRKSSPSPTPDLGRRELPQISESMELVENVIEVDEVKEEKGTAGMHQGKDESQISDQVIKQDEETSQSSDMKVDIEVEENLIPSPSTEDDPPSFDITSSQPKHVLPAQVDGVDIQLDSEDQVNEEEGYSGPIRMLKPISTFNGFMLYTPDDPLAGFRSDELLNRKEGNVDEEGKETKDQNGNNDKNEVKAENKEENGEHSDNNNTSDASIQVRKSWWRSGGSGEGGDEFIRGLGEYLGLVDILNEPIYLDGLEDDDSDDE